MSHVINLLIHAHTSITFLVNALNSVLNINHIGWSLYSENFWSIFDNRVKLINVFLYMYNSVFINTNVPTVLCTDKYTYARTNKTKRGFPIILCNKVNSWIYTYKNTRLQILTYVNYLKPLDYYKNFYAVIINHWHLTIALKKRRKKEISEKFKIYFSFWNFLSFQEKSNRQQLKQYLNILFGVCFYTAKNRWVSIGKIWM